MIKAALEYVVGLKKPEIVKQGAAYIRTSLCTR